MNNDFAYAELLRRSHHDHGFVADCPACRVTPTPLEIGRAMVVALLEARGDLRWKSYGEVLDTMHAALEAFADNHAWSSRLALNCERFTENVR